MPEYSNIAPTNAAEYYQVINDIVYYTAYIKVDTSGVSSTSITYKRFNDDEVQTNVVNLGSGNYSINANLASTALTENEHIFSIDIVQIKSGVPFSFQHTVTYHVHYGPQYDIQLTPEQQAQYGKSIHFFEDETPGHYYVDLVVKNSIAIDLYVKDNTGVYHIIGTKYPGISGPTPTTYRYLVKLQDIAEEKVPGYQTSRDFLDRGLLMRFVNHYEFLGHALTNYVEFWCKPQAHKIKLEITLNKLYTGDDKEPEWGYLEIFFKTYIHRNDGTYLLFNNYAGFKSLPINTDYTLSDKFPSSDLKHEYPVEGGSYGFERGFIFEIQVWDKDFMYHDHRMSLFIELDPNGHVKKGYQFTRNLQNDGTRFGFMWYTQQYYTFVNQYSYFSSVTIKCTDAVPYGAF